MGSPKKKRRKKRYNSSPGAVNCAKDRYTMQFQKEKLLRAELASPSTTKKCDLQGEIKTSVRERCAGRYSLAKKIYIYISRCKEGELGTITVHD